MAAMPRGQSRTVPDPAGELYDQQMAQLKAQRAAEEQGPESPLGAIGDAFEKWQEGPRMARPNLAESFIPVVGPAWEAVADIQDKNYTGAAFNGVMAVADALPIGVVGKGLRAASKGAGILKKGSLTAGAATSRLRAWGIAKKGEEVHHTIPLNGTSRSAQDWRNHYAFLKVLPKDVHRRLTGSWAGKPRFDPIRRVWYGTTDWMKAVPTGVAGYAADAWENLSQPFESPTPQAPPPGTQPPQPSKKLPARR
ncbi:hypothetical protein [Phenylobacterium aquaticum]|uniref:hypothetical protein n=1 Tax=Phenylobacterium aquaticum TaxID=1763816 RepID=UPI0026EB41C0|nr:hypothetical protein [Phenylobacterium aquaticum]